jgi:proteic killer suppression protein
LPFASSYRLITTWFSTVTFLQRTFTSLVHAHAGRTQIHKPDLWKSATNRLCKALGPQVDSRCAPRYTAFMIKSFKHKGLRLFFEKGSTSGIQQKHAKKLRMQLAAIHSAKDIDDINVPGFSLHRLKGDRSNIWSITVNGNWRVTFEFKDSNAYILNYEDYH